MADTTTKGFPYPEGPDPVDVAGDIQALAEAVDAMPGVRSYTATEIAGLTAGQKWAGRVVYNSTSGRLQVSNGSTFADVDSTTLSSVNPSALGVAAPGTSTDVSRADHVHAMPTASQVGAPATSLTITAGNGLTGGGDLSANRTIAANFSATNPAMNGTAGAGSANAVSRGDHVHPTDTSRAPLASPTFTGTPAAPTAAADTNTTQVATTAYVVGQAGTANPIINGTAAPGTSLRYARQDHVHPTDTSRAALASPTFTGTPAAPTAAADTNTTQIATTAYVIGQAGSTTPAALGSAAVGTSNRYARADHVHAMPTAANVGAIATTALTSTNPAALGATAAPGSSTNVARLDHVHARPTPADIGAVAKSLINAAGQVIASTGSATPAVVTAGTTDGHVLTWDNAVSTKMKWAAPSGGGAAIDPLFLSGV